MIFRKKRLRSLRSKEQGLKGTKRKDHTGFRLVRFPRIASRKPREIETLQEAFDAALAEIHLCLSGRDCSPNASLGRAIVVPEDDFSSGSPGDAATGAI
jgi:hypothetical protein